MVSFLGTVTSPSSVPSSPVIRRKIVVLPAPLGPTSPTFSPGLSWNDASTNRTCPPYCLHTPVNEIISRAEHRPAGGARQPEVTGVQSTRAPSGRADRDREPG